MKNARRCAWTLCALLALAAGLRAAEPPANRDWEPIKGVTPPHNRYVTFQELIAKGPHLKVAAATFFGAADNEEFLDAGALADGTLAAFGNAWGPAFPDAPPPQVLGKGKHAGLKPLGTVGKGLDLRPTDPDCAAFVVFYTAGLRSIQKVVRFDWGVASLTAGAVTRDGQALLLAGRCTPAFRALKDQAGSFKTQAGSGGQYVYDGVQCSGDVYVLRLSGDGAKIEWAWVLEANGGPPETLWTDKNGNVYFDAKGLTRISADGQVLKVINPKTQSGIPRWLFVDPEDGSAFFGGDRNTHTHKEPWRQPYLYKFDPAGQKLWALWEFSPADVGSDHGGLESDSSIRGVSLTKDGDLIVSGWSDGGNSVLPRLAKDWKKNAPLGGLGMTPWWPHGANGFGHLMLLDAKTQDSKAHVWWVGYTPENFVDEKARNRPTSMKIEKLTTLEDGAIAFAGSAASGLLQTPNAFWKDPGKGEKYGGSFAAVYDKDLKNILFSSYLPGCKSPRLGVTKTGLLVATRSAGADGATTPTPSPAVNALQPFKGATDAHLILLEAP